MGFSSRLVAFALFLALATVPASAQERPGEVNGRIINSRDGEPLSLVQVQLAGTTFQAVSGDDGKFRIVGVPPGAYTLQTAAVGYQVIYQDFTLTAAETKPFEIVLTSTTTALTDSASVTADVFNEPEPSAAGFTLQGDERKNLASVLADDPLRAVQTLPGVTANDDFSSEFSVRGAPFGRIGLYLDGVLLHSPFHTTNGQADDGSLTIFNGDLTDDMTLYQGAWPVRFSDRTAGVLNVDTREGTRQEVRAQFSASASNAGLLVEGPWSRSRRGSWLLAVRKSYLQYILNRIDFGDQAPLAFGFTDGQGRLDYDLTPRNALSLSYVDGSSAVNRTRYRDELGPNTVMTSGFHSTLLNLGSRYASERLLLTSHLAWSREKGSVANRDHVALSNEYYVESTVRSDATFMWSKKNTLDFGGQFRQARQDGLTTQLVYAPELTSTADLVRGKGHQEGGYVQDSIAFARGRITAGARQDAHSVSPTQTTSPYASLSFEPSTKTRLQFDWGHYAQFPELNQYFSTFAHGPLLPERATHYDAAVERRINERTRLRLEFYDRQDRDLLARPGLDPRVLSTGVIVQALPTAPLLNSEHGYSRGIQFLVQRRTANGFTGWVSYAYGHAALTDDTLRLSYAADYDQRHTVNAYLSRRLRPTVNISGHFTYGSGMPLPGFYQIVQGTYTLSAHRNGVRAPLYERMDLRLNKDYTHRKFNTTLYAEVINVTDHTNRDFDSAGPYDPNTGRTAPNFYSMFPILPSVGMVFAF
jgi:Carboxypeptidase regulatory-like domain